MRQLPRVCDNGHGLATRLEELQPRCTVPGIHPDGLVTAVSVQWFGSEALERTYKTTTGAVANEILYRDDAARLGVEAQERPWSFDGDGALVRLVSEAQRILLAHSASSTQRPRCERERHDR